MRPSRAATERQLDLFARSGQVKWRAQLLEDLAGDWQLRRALGKARAAEAKRGVRDIKHELLCGSNEDRVEEAFSEAP